MPGAPESTHEHAVGVDSAELGRALRAAVRGEVGTDAGTRALYATDASNYRVPPRAVVLPRSVADVEATVALCRELGVPLTARGGGTSVAGNAIGPGVVLDFSRHLNRVLHVDIAIPLHATPDIKNVQLLVKTKTSF